MGIQILYAYLSGYICKGEIPWVEKELSNQNPVHTNHISQCNNAFVKESNSANCIENMMTILVKCPK